MRREETPRDAGPAAELAARAGGARTDTDKAAFEVRSLQDDAVPFDCSLNRRRVAATRYDVDVRRLKPPATVDADHRVVGLVVAFALTVADVAGVERRPDHAIGTAHHEQPDLPPDGGRVTVEMRPAIVEQGDWQLRVLPGRQELGRWERCGTSRRRPCDGEVGTPGTASVSQSAAPNDARPCALSSVFEINSRIASPELLTPTATEAGGTPRRLRVEPPASLARAAGR